MPVDSIKLNDTDHLSFEWSVVDENELARLVALLMLGQHRHVNRILETLSPSPMPISGQAIDAAVAQLSNTSVGNLENRDGWLFQLISWIALNRRTEGKLFLDAPHPMPAFKGFDGVAIRLVDDRSAVKFVLLTEDKATDNPRKVFREEIIPELEKTESRSNESRIMAKVSTLVDQCTVSLDDAEKLLSTSFLGSSVRHRVCIGTSKSKLPKKTKTVEGFDKAIPGDQKRRGAELLILPDLRMWIQRIAVAAIAHLDEMRTDEDAE